MADDDRKAITGESAVHRDIDELVELLTQWCTGQHREVDHSRFRQLRSRLMHDPSVQRFLPDFLREMHDLSGYWERAKQDWGGTYAERRSYLQGAFAPARSHLEALEWGAPADETIRQDLAAMNVPVIEQLWDKALSRRAADPDGAITAARTLLETVCKHILDDFAVSYPGDADLPALYRLVSKSLNLAPDDAVNETLRRVFGGCSSIVEGIGSLRNQMSDAHGRGRGGSVAAEHYATLAVNLSGAMAAFLCSVWDEASELPF